MKRLRRKYVPGGTYFFTVVTHERRPILTTDLGRTSLRAALLHQQKIRPFEIVAIVLLPDHLHTIWVLPPEDTAFSLRWSQVKERFTRLFLASGGTEGQSTENRVKHRNRAIWQHRFWEHCIESETDFQSCFDYIHWNPVRHGYVQKPKEYPYSSFNRWVEAKLYDENWGEAEIPDIPGAEQDGN